MKTIYNWPKKFVESDRYSYANANAPLQKLNVRIAVIPAPSDLLDNTNQLHIWPLNIDPKKYADMSNERCFKHSILVTGQDALLLRNERDKYQTQGPYPSRYSNAKNAIPFHHQGQNYMALVRDVLPFEDVQSTEAFLKMTPKPFCR